MAAKIVVVLREFVSAVAALPKLKRGPRGSFGNSIPTDTLLYSVENRLVVFTPAKKTILGMAGSWSGCVSTEARRLSLVSSKLKVDDFLTLTFAEGFIVLNDPAFSVPGRLVERPDDE